MREEFSKIRDGLHARNPAICGAAPEWIIEQVEKRLDATLANLTPEEEAAKIEDFVRGAVRYIDDHCGSECDALANTLYELIRPKN